MRLQIFILKISYVVDSVIIQRYQIIYLPWSCAKMVRSEKQHIEEHEDEK